MYQAQELQRLYDLCRELGDLIWEAQHCDDANDDMDLAALRRELRKPG